MAVKKIKTVLGEKKAPKPTKEQVTNWPTATLIEENIDKKITMKNGSTITLKKGKKGDEGIGLTPIPRQPFENRKKNTARFSKKKKK